jgi:hypothetical protein
MPKARGRFVNFRVTDDEFQQLKLACDRQGSLGTSAFARKVIFNSLNSSEENFADRLVALDRRLSACEVSLSHLHNALAGSSADAGDQKKQP